MNTPNPTSTATHTPGALRAAYEILRHPEVNCGIFHHIADEFAVIIDNHTQAPDLLAALEILTRWADDNIADPAATIPINQAKAAIARARGQGVGT